MEVIALSRPKSGEEANGDAYLVESYESGAGEEKVLIAVVDGLGHGKGAEVASKTAIDFIRAHKYLPLKEMVKSLHIALIGTRGVVIGISEVSIPDDKLSYIGIGNISSQIVNDKERYHLTSMNGVLGWNLRRIKEFKYDFQSGWLVMNTDGIGRFHAYDYISTDLHAMALKIVQEHGKDDDDATIVIALK